jgi:hypothetical protein
VELDWYDSYPDGYVAGSLVQCDYLDQNCTNHPAAGAGPADCTNPGYICSGALYEGGLDHLAVDMTADNVVANNFLSNFRLIAGNIGAGDGTLQVRGMIVGYVLQVSPPPPTATFNDVPTSHPFFQYVEALYASGITAGCQVSPPLYCPNSPLTRGQMAVFLAKALGLQWN